MKSTLLASAFITVCCLSSGAQTWTTQTAVALHVGQHGAVAHPNGNVYEFGGYSSSVVQSGLNIFNQSGNSWTTGAAIPSPTRGMGTALGPDSTIYCISGYNTGYVTTSYKYKPSTNVWTAIANIPTPVWIPAAATVGGKVIVFGGENGLTLVQIYNPITNTWSAGTPVPTGVKGNAAVTANGKVYVIGGLATSVTGMVQIYDPVGNSWTAGAAMPTPRVEFAATLGPDGKIYCMGGKSTTGNNSSPFYNKVEIYDPVGNTWTTGTILPHGIGETAGVTINNGINVFAGADSSNVYSTYNFRTAIAPLGIAEYSSDMSFNVFPNPSSGILNFSVSASAEENVCCRIMDMNGRLVYSENLNHFTGTLNKTIDISSFGKGLYLVQCVSDKGQFTRKVIIE